MVHGLWNLLPGHSLTATFAAAALAAPCFAAPSTELPAEWFVPLETAAGYALVDKDSGQLRCHVFSNANALAEIGPLHTGLPGITGASSGFAGPVEHVALASVYSNKLAFVPRDGGTPVELHPQLNGPAAAALVKTNPADPDSVVIHGLYGSGGHALELTDTPLGTPAPVQSIDSLPALSALQPLREPVTGERMAVAVWQLASPPQLLRISRVGAALNGDAHGEVGIDARLAPDCRGPDGRACVLAWEPGDTQPVIFTMPFGAFVAERNVTATPLPFPAGSIAAVPPAIPNAPDGVLVTAADGSSAVYAEIDAGKDLAIKESFAPSPGDRFTGLLPVAGRGFIGFEAPPGGNRSTRWRLFRNGGGGWAEVASGALAPWLPPDGRFAGMFWFKGTPLVDLDAELLKLESRPDWTRKSAAAAIPPTVYQEIFVDSATGLGNPAGFAPSPPPTASYLLTNQYLDSVSVTALSGQAALTSPPLRVLPESGSYPETVRVTADFNERMVEVFYRFDTFGAQWQPYDAPLHIAYTSTLLFHARDLATGVNGPIVTRHYTLPAAGLNSADSDLDQVPDYVEQHLGLSPVGGADSDGDGQSDLEEILGGTNPNAQNDLTPEASRNPPYLGEGFRVIALPFDGAGAHASAGEQIDLHDMRCSLLASGNVDTFPAPPAIPDQQAAVLDASDPTPAREWVVLSSPEYFNLGTSPNPPRDGRETFRVLQRPADSLLEPVTAPSGGDLAADAATWISAAQTAFATYQRVAAVTEMRPVDNAIAALCEQALFDALSALDPATRAALGVPAAAADFTLFGFRDGENRKTKLSGEMIEALAADGCDLRALLGFLDTGARAAPAIVNLAGDLHDRHVAVSDANPAMALPLDALRSVIRTGAIADPAPGDPPRANPYSTITPAQLAAAKAAFDALLAGAPSTKRPLDTWTLEIQSSTRPGDRYDYRHIGDGDLAWLVDENGDRTFLDQGLGLRHGTRFTVQGYTDASGAPAGYHGMELVRILGVTSPQASDHDSNGNLLDDEWEYFFFGKLGAVGPLDPHPVSGHTYLQYHLSGADPRAGNLTEPVLDLAPANVKVVKLPNNNFGLQFDFPEAFFAHFEFSALRSPDLATPFVPNELAGAPASLGPGTNRWVIDLGATYSSQSRHFFRLMMALK